MIKDGEKVFILGIDGAPPELIFEKWKDDLPNLNSLMKQGAYAEVESSIPPLTCAAWTSFSTGRSSGDHGLFEYIYRKNNDPEDMGVISADNIKHKTFWQILSERGKKSIIVGVPITWPIKPFNGNMVTGFMTPGTDRQYTHPEELGEELKKVLGREYIIDIENYRKLSKEELIKKVYEMTEVQFEAMKYLIKNKEWDLFFGVIIGSDRMNHNFWRFFDALHRKYEKNEFSNVLKEFYIYVDKKIGELTGLLDKETRIIIASDHGTIRMHNRVNLSDWLIREGHLVLKEPLREKKKLTPEMVDWNRTRASAIGAFEGQIYVNLKGRDPKGIVDEKDYDLFVDELEKKIKEIKGDDGNALNTIVFKRKRDYDGEARDSAPDMVVYFDNLQYGCNASLVGNESLWSPSTAMGSDDAVHSRKGIFITNKKIKVSNLKIEDISRIVLDEFGEKEKKIKKICTIGPSSSSEEILMQLRENGMDYARINISHTEFEEAKKLIDSVSKIGIPTILDTQGKEIRINEAENINLKDGEIIEISDNKKTKICFSRKIIPFLSKNEMIYVDDEKIVLKVLENKEDRVVCRVIRGGELKKNRVVKLNHKICLEPLTERDKRIIEYGITKGIRIVALSFADSREDVLAVKLIFPEVEVIPKIENLQGVLNVDEILDEVSSLWIDRFDLGTFIGFEKVPLIQKMIIKKCNSSEKDIFIASHLLESMIKEGNPTRAEINDIANTILDGATGLVLAAETAAGLNPVASLKTLNKIVNEIGAKNHTDIFGKIESERMLSKLRDMGYINEDFSEEKSIEITKENAMDAVCLCNGAFSPLRGFMRREDYQSVLDKMRLANGEVWTLPILLLLNEKEAGNFKEGDEIFLDYNSEKIAVLHISEKYTVNKEEYFKKVFQTSDENHPGVIEMKKMGNVALAGEIKLIKNPFENEFELSPEEVRKLIKEGGFKKIAAFHTRNPIHRSHEFLQRSALEFSDALFINPVIGKKKSGDFNEKYIIESYKIMAEKFYPRNKIIFSTLSTYSRYAGPREAVFTALIRKNFGATHFIVGRDHTGVGNYYGKYDSQKIFDELGDIGIEIMKFHAPFYCNICKQYVSEHTCNHEKDRLDISGTQIREMLKKGTNLPEEIMRLEISGMLTEAIKNGEEVFVR